MTRCKKLARIALYGAAALCALLLVYWIGAELYGNYIAAQWEAAGYPDLRGSHTIQFWIKALATAGAGLLAAGAALSLGPGKPKRRSVKIKHERNEST